MAIDSRYLPLPASKRCGLSECWCTPPEPPKKDYGTREAEPEQRMVPRALAKPPLTYQITEKF
ncbi:MAG TPA: hypothetical protein VGB13_10940 [Candidatus Krumholzibacteria bacterium]